MLTLYLVDIFLRGRGREKDLWILLDASPVFEFPIIG